MARSFSWMAWLTSLNAGFTGVGGFTSWRTSCWTSMPIPYISQSRCSSALAWSAIASRPIVSTSSTLWSPTTWRMAASVM